MGEVVLHIGSGKTGTTALQGFLARNRENLVSHGLLYPDILRYGIRTHIAHHNPFGQALTGDLGWYRLRPEDYVSQFREQRRRAGGNHTLVLSAETFFGEPQPWTVERVSKYWERYRTKVERLSALLEGEHARVILYLRRQDLWLESAIAQTIKFEGLLPHPVYSDYVQFASVMAPRLNYEMMLSIWEENFGSACITVKPYERQSLCDADIVTDFCHTIGAKSLLTYREGGSDKVSANLGWNLDVLEYKRRLNRLPREKWEERALAELCGRVSADLGKSDERYILPRWFRQQLVDNHRNGNQRIAEKYLGVQKLFLFSDPEPNDTDESLVYEGLSDSSAAGISRQLSSLKKSMNGRGICARHWASAVLRRKFPFIYVATRDVIRRLRKIL